MPPAIRAHAGRRQVVVATTMRRSRRLNDGRPRQPGRVFHAGTPIAGWRAPAPTRCRRADAPPPRSISSSRVRPRSSRSTGVAALRTSGTDANAETINVIGAVTECSPCSSRHCVCIDKLSLPTGIAIPNAGHSSIPTAVTASNNAWSSVPRPAAAIQFADNTTRARSSTAIGEGIFRPPIASAPTPVVDQRKRRSLAPRHRFALQRLEAERRHRRVGDGDLPRPDHLVAHHEAGDAAIADRNEKLLRAHGRETQHPIKRTGERQVVRQIECGGFGRSARNERCSFGTLPNSTATGRSTTARCGISSPTISRGSTRIANDRERTPPRARRSVRTPPDRHAKRRARGPALVAPAQRCEPGSAPGSRRISAAAASGIFTRLGQRQTAAGADVGSTDRIRSPSDAHTRRSLPGSAAAFRRCRAAPTRSRDRLPWPEASTTQRRRRVRSLARRSR